MINFLGFWRKYVRDNLGYVFVILILIGIFMYRLYKNFYSHKIDDLEGFQDAPDKLQNLDEETLAKVLVLIEERLNEKDIKTEKIQSIRKKLEQGESLNKDELDTLTSLYGSYTQLQNHVNKLQSQTNQPTQPNQISLATIIQLLEKTQELLKEDTQMFTEVTRLLEEHGYQISFAQSGEFLGIQKAPTAEVPAETGLDLEQPGEVEKLLYQQLVKKINKLREINDDNIKYYKQLNTDQQELLLEIINKRNAEIDKLRKMLSQIKNKLKKLIPTAEMLGQRKEIISEEAATTLPQVPRTGTAVIPTEEIAITVPVLSIAPSAPSAPSAPPAPSVPSVPTTQVTPTAPAIPIVPAAGTPAVPIAPAIPLLPVSQTEEEESGYKKAIKNRTDEFRCPIACSKDCFVESPYYAPIRGGPNPGTPRPHLDATGHTLHPAPFLHNRRQNDNFEGMLLPYDWYSKNT